jgi:hypothetical protein
MWRYRYLFEILSSFPEDIYPEVELLDHSAFHFYLLIFGGMGFELRASHFLHRCSTT